MNCKVKYLAELVKAQLEQRTPQRIPDGISVEELVQVARDNHMTYLLMGALLRTDNLPDEWKEPMQAAVMKSMWHTGVQVMELKEMERRFEEKKIACQPMKGSRLKFIYPTPEMREMSDIDVLIRKDCMENAASELQEMGYEMQESIKHHDIYVKQPYMVIEAHRAMYDKTVDHNQYEYFSDLSKAELRDGYKYMYDFNTEDFYIYMVAHMAKHFFAMGCGIRNLVDIYVYRKRYAEKMNEKYLREEFEKLGLSSFIQHMENLTEIWLEGKEGSDFYDHLFDYMMQSGIYGKDENGIWNKFCKENANKKVSRFQLKRWYCFPPIYYMAEYYPWVERYKWLLPAAWMIRGARGIIRKKGTQKRKMIGEIEQKDIRIYQNIYYEMQLHFK